MVPTVEARLFFREVEGAFSGLTHLKAAAARIRDFGSGEIRIASLSALSTNIMPRALRNFQKRHPDVAITFQARMNIGLLPFSNGAFRSGLQARHSVLYRRCFSAIPYPCQCVPDRIPSGGTA